MSLRITDICAQDTGGQSYRMARAIRDHTPHESHSFCRTPDYLAWPAEEHRLGFKGTWTAGCDIVHVHNKYRYANGSAINRHAKWLIHQHGRQPFPIADLEAADRARKALRVVSTINLLRYAGHDPERWIPAPMRLSDFEPNIDHKGIWIAHSPTNRAYKGTDEITDVVRQLKDEGHDVSLRLIEGKPHAESMAERARCQITYDQMHLCYGNSGLEGMAFGQPTIVGMDDRTHADVERIIGYRPYTTATSPSLYEVVKRLVGDAGLREEEGARARKYIEDWHDEEKVAAKMAAIYEGL